MRTTLLLLLMMLTSLSVWANETFTVDDLTYMVVSESSETVNVWKYSGTMPANYNMVIPASVTNPNNSTLYTVIGIESGVFMNKTNLTSVSIPASMTRISQQAFEGCTNLETVSIPEANGVTDVGGDAFSGTKWLNDQPNGVVYVGKVAYLGKNVSGEISINDGTVSISEEAFLNCTGLTSVTIPNGVTDIGSSAFFGCTNLTSITIPNSVTFIQDRAFSGSGLTSITIPNGVTNICYETFKGCTSLTSVTIPNSVTFIDDGAFWNCTSLTSITIPASVQTIMNGAFYGCYNLKTVTIYAPPCNLGTDAFLGCNDDLQIYVFSDLADDYQGAENWSKYVGIITAIPNQSGNCGQTGDDGSDVTWSYNTMTKALTISGTGQMMYYGSALGSDSQYHSTAPWSHFDSEIETVVVEDGVTYIGSYAFAYCSSLTSISLPASVVALGDYVCYGSSNGSTNLRIDIPSVVAVTIGAGGFDATPANLKIAVPAELLDDYQVATNWSGYAAKMVGVLSETTGFGTTFATGNYEYKRTFNCGVAATLCLPFDMTSISGGKVYEFVGVTYDDVDGWVATMSDATPGSNLVTSTQAHRPYLFLPDADGEVVFRGSIKYLPMVITAGTSTSGDWTFHGTYDRLDYGDEGFSGTVFGFAATSGKATDGMTDVEAGQFVKAGSGAYILPFRAFLTYSGSNTALHAPARGVTDTPAIPDRIKVRLLSSEGATTANGTIDMNTGEITIDQWYYLNGQPVEGTPSAPGLYLNSDGKKVMLTE